VTGRRCAPLSEGSNGRIAPRVRRFAFLAIVLLVSATLTACRGSQARARPWHSVQLVRDMTGDGRPDTLTLEARGTRPDSLDVTFVIRGNGHELFRDAWNNADEFADERNAQPAKRISPDSLARRVRHEMDTFFDAANFASAASLQSAPTWPPVSFDCKGDPRDCIAFHLRYERGVAARARRGQDSTPASTPEYGAFIDSLEHAPFDTAYVRRVVDEMRQRGLPAFTFSYGYETTRSITWSPMAGRFFPVFECC